MKRIVWGLVLVFSALLTGCASYELEEEAEPELVHQEVIYYGRYTNMAWVPVDRGFYIDQQGQVFIFEKEGYGRHWEQETYAVFTPEELAENLVAEADYLFTLQSDWVTDHTAVVAEVSQQLLSDPESRGADQGALSLYVLEYRPDYDLYTEHLLGTEGDWEVHREGETARSVKDWLGVVYQEVQERN